MARSSRSRREESEPASQADVDSNLQKKPVVIFVHGIRDPGFWQQKLKKLFVDEGFEAIPIGYGVFDLFRFLFGFRAKAVATVKSKIEVALSNNKGAQVTVIAHSFGTYIVSKLLEQDTTIEIERLIMCGAVVRRNYRWDRTVNLNGSGQNRLEVINEFSAKDIWPLMARQITFGLGDVGSIGCQDPNVTDRQHSVPHSAYLEVSFAKTFWLPHMKKGFPLITPDVATSAPWYMLLNRLPFTLTAFLCPLVLALGVFLILDRLTFSTNGEWSIVALEGDVPKIEVRGFTEFEARKHNIDNADLSKGVALLSAPTSGEKQYKFVADQKFPYLMIDVSNRLPTNCLTSESGASEDQSPVEQAHDIPTIALARSRTLHSRFWYDLKNAWKMTGKGKISLTYYEDVFVDNPSKTRDQLILKAGDGLDSTKIKKLAFYRTDQERCKDQSDNISDFDIAEANLDSSWSIFGRAYAQQSNSALKADDVASLVRSTDIEARSIGLKAISNNPAIYKNLVPQIALDTGVDPAVRAELIQTSRNASIEPILLDTKKVIELTYDNNLKLRDAARSYLRAPLIVSPSVKAEIEVAINNQRDALRNVPVEGRNYNKDYLLYLAARDVYYNLGVKLLEEYQLALAKSQQPKLLQQQFDAVISEFESGTKLSAFIGSSQQRIPFAKNIYGKAMAQTRSAMMREAVLKKKQGQSVFDYITQAKLAGTKIGDTSGKITFQNFIREVGEQSDLYPWPLHLEQADRCLKDYTFACLNGTSDQ